MKWLMAFDATLFQTSRTTNLPGFVPAREHFTLKDCFSSIVAEIVPVYWTIFARGMPGRCRPKQMKATLSGLLRIWLRLISRGDLLENFCDSKGKTLFQSHLTKLWNRFPIISWIPFFDRAHGTVIASSKLHKPVAVSRADWSSTGTFLKTEIKS